MTTSNSPEALIPQRLREERRKRDWTLDELSERSGVSRAMISKIERGQSSPTAALLSRLGDAMGVGLSAFMSESHSARPGLRVVQDQPTWTDPETGYVRRLVSPAGDARDVEIVAIELPVGANVAFAAADRLQSEEQVLLMEGALRIECPAHCFDLKPGDCARVAADQEISYRNVGAGLTRYLVVKRLVT